MCNNLHQAVSQELIKAIEDYKETTGNYPENLDALVPDYIVNLPVPICLRPYDWFKPTPLTYNSRFARFYLHHEEDQVVLCVKSPKYGYYQFYDFTVHSWDEKEFGYSYLCG